MIRKWNFLTNNKKKNTFKKFTRIKTSYQLCKVTLINPHRQVKIDPSY